MDIMNQDPHKMRLEKSKTSGANHLWDGPLDTTGYPMGKGSSRGKNGMKLKMDQPVCKKMRIDQIAENCR